MPLDPFIVLSGLLFPLVGAAGVVYGVYVLLRLRPRARVRAERAVSTTGTVVGSESRRRSGRGSRSSRISTGFVPVVTWTGPDGRSRTQVPEGAPRTVHPPTDHSPVDVSYDPEDLGWLEVTGRSVTSGALAAKGAVAIAVGLLLMVNGSTSLLLSAWTGQPPT